MILAQKHGLTLEGLGREEFDALANQSRPQLFQWAYRIVRNPTEAEDVTQEALLKAWRAYPRFDGRNWIGWLRRIVTNTALNRLAALNRTQTVSLNEPTESAFGEELLSQLPCDVEDQPERQAMARETCRQIDLAMSTLPAEWAITLRMHVVDGCTYEQIAPIMGCPPGTVRSRIHRARARLQSVLAEGTLEAA